MDFDKLSPVCYQCSSSLKMEDLIKKKAEFSIGTEFVQMFENNSQIKDKLLAAYVNALIRNEEESMRSNELSNEMLALVSGEMNVGKAIKKAGAKHPNDFLLFLTDKKFATKAKTSLKLAKMEPVKMELDTTLSSQVAAAPLLED